MSYICDVCGPRLEWDAALCHNCNIGILYEITTGGIKKKPAATIKENAAKQSASQQQLSFNIQQVDRSISMGTVNLIPCNQSVDLLARDVLKIIRFS